MRFGVSLALVCGLILGEFVQGQEMLPPPQPGPTQRPAALAPPGAEAPAPPPTTPFGSGFAEPPPPFLIRDAAGNPTFWMGFEALLWWTKGQPLTVPLVTTGPASQGDSAGNLGAPGTVSLNGPLHYDADGGLRLFAGGWFDADHNIGMDGSFFILGRQCAQFTVFDRSGLGNMVINEPLAGSPPFMTQVSAPGLATGAVAVGASSRFGGGDIDILWNLYRGERWTVNLLGGYRYLQLDESLNIASNSRLFTTITYSDDMGNILANAGPGSTITVVDHFGTRNQFNGGQLGAYFQYLWNRWSLAASTKLAIGSTYETITIRGDTQVFPVGDTPVRLGGGNFATLQGGRYATNHFAVAPEAQLNIGYQLTPWLRAQVGYTFLYLSSVARPGQQIDNLFDGVTHPGVPMTSSGWWGQGLNFSLQYRF